MKRLNMIIGKKQLVIASLAVVLGAAAAINIAVQTGKKEGVQPSKQVSGSSYGETVLVSGKASDSAESGSTDAYFANARLEKQQARDEASQVLSVMYQGGDMTGGELEAVAANAKKLSEAIESENAVETILKAQGFEDALCYLSDKGANIIVKTDGLDAAAAAKIKSALLSEVEVAADCITIVEVK